MKVLIACEESQTVCKAFRELGHEAYSCDIQDCSGGHPEWHFKQDVLPLLKQHWDLIIAHPPCTYMSKAGARWMYPKAGQLSEERYRLSQEAKDFFMVFSPKKTYVMTLSTNVDGESGTFYHFENGNKALPVVFKIVK